MTPIFVALHPTMKPVAMIADAIKDVSTRNGIVLDLFGGSGSTLIAAHKTGRRGYTCELDPVYCDRIIRRWQAYAKDDAVLESTRQRFEEISHDRQLEEAPRAPGKARRSRTDAAVSSIPVISSLCALAGVQTGQPLMTAGVTLRSRPQTGKESTGDHGDLPLFKQAEA